MSADTLESRRFFIIPSPLRGRDLLSTEYLERALQRSGERMNAALARRYADRYDIEVDLARQILTSARAAGIDPDLAFRLVWVESRFNVRARGPRGALGLTQLMPSTARWLDRTVRTEADILHPPTNLRLGFHYLRTLIEKYGDTRLGLLAYNRGTGTVDRVLRQGRDPENGYSRKVFSAGGGGSYRGRGVLQEAARP